MSSSNISSISQTRKPIDPWPISLRIPFLPFQALTLSPMKPSAGIRVYRCSDAQDPMRDPTLKPPDPSPFCSSTYPLRAKIRAAAVVAAAAPAAQKSPPPPGISQLLRLGHPEGNLLR
ncbi:uncharacterized protein CCOS01_06012 [Colletotrichum costaricense]|uniref:Uncharacterized protein n=1 Tax=Colletotrichum costaricense TaxID=1209916 RepID=A0AAJ0E3Q9_9PEZI|nr:uncharacterized protein CCOS01_06012 [Colletotrichum costaricense]KAK1530909.1 hypothetical protein CCOS01_06012 [Colletotrichum costaricense]